MKQGSLQVKTGKIDDAYAKALKKATKAAVIQNIMQRKPAVFTKSAKIKKLIANRLGWVDSAAKMKRQVSAIEKFGQSVIKSGVEHVVLMGMGGSSLCPDLIGKMHRKRAGLKSFNVIDSTDPAAVRAVARMIEPKKTLFIVASKSGGTVETRSHEAFFIGLLKENKVRNIGKHFVAITDPGSGLQKDAKKLKYRKVFLNPADIGGRYSALSYFGLVPAYFAGADIRAMVEDAVAFQKLLNEREGETNPAMVLGTLMAVAAKEGIDKLTFVASKKTAPLVPWIEQLVAESTGKSGKGVVPIDNEPLGKIEQYKRDRLFVFLKMAGEKNLAGDRFRKSFGRKKTSIVDIELGSKAELGRQFLLWEAATAVAGYHFGINPFDEPNVTESKNNTNAILAAFERSGAFPDQEPQKRWGKLTLVGYDNARKYSRAQMKDITTFVKRFLQGGKPSKYIAMLNYFKTDSRTEAALEKARKLLRDKTGMATLRGYGPRFLHSIGQLYKGGPRDGMFVVFVKSNYGRLPIPGQFFDFGQLIAAQAIGDSQALMNRDLPTLVIAIDGNPADGLDAFVSAVRRALK